MSDITETPVIRVLGGEYQRSLSFTIDTDSNISMMFGVMDKLLHCNNICTKTSDLINLSDKAILKWTTDFSMNFALII